jgi:hypothetical protein
MGLGIMICFRLKVETLIIHFRLIPLFLCFNLVQSPITNIVNISDVNISDVNISDVNISDRLQFILQELKSQWQLP